MRTVREHCELLWKADEPHADPQFRTEIRSSFDARYWEMYLTTFLIREGYAVSSPKPGPDAGIEFEGRRIWFEATAPILRVSRSAAGRLRQRAVEEGLLEAEDGADQREVSADSRLEPGLSIVRLVPPSRSLGT
jgi:hypothetical protein